MIKMDLNVQSSSDQLMRRILSSKLSNPRRHLVVIAGNWQQWPVIRKKVGGDSPPLEIGGTVNSQLSEIVGNSQKLGCMINFMINVIRELTF